jgi:putative ABC transport system permease protein
MGKLLRRFAYFLRQNRLEAELAEEMEIHREMKRQALEAQDVTSSTAEKRELGNLTLAREESRAVWIPLWLEQLGQDVRYGLRMLRRNPGFTLVVVLTLAIGVGANTAVFTLIDAMLFRPTPWSRDTQLVWIGALQGRSGRIGNMSHPDYVAYRDQATTLSMIAAYRGTAMAIGGSRPRRVRGAVTSANFFDVVGVRAPLGRTFTPEENSLTNTHPVVVLSDALWRDHFGADPSVLGTTVSINGAPFTIIGIASRRFTGVVPDEAQLWIPLAMQSVAMPAEPGLLQAPDGRWLRVVARLREGVTLAQADAEISTIARQLNLPNTPPEREKRAQVIPVRGSLTVDEQRQLAPIFGMIALVPALVLLVACANVANVLMARNVSRQKELAMRRAIGASRGRLIRQQLTEAALFALLAALGGFLASFGLITVITRLGTVPPDVVALIQPELRALLATAGVSMAATLVFGLAPAFVGAKGDVLPTLKNEGTTTTQARCSRYLSRTFIVAQVAVSLVLLISAGLLLQSFYKALHVDPGFDFRDVVIASFDPNLQRYTEARRDSFVNRLIEQASTIPGVTSAAVTTSLPLSGDVYGSRVIADSPTDPVPAMSSSVTPRYFETLQVPFVHGRDFSATDVATAPQVVIVNEGLARRLWSTTNGIGRRLRLAGDNEPWREVVGVVRDIKHESLTESPRYGLFMPLWQRPNAPLTVVARTTSAPNSTLLALEEGAARLDPDLPLFNVRRLADAVRQEVNLRRASASLVGVFGALALLLAAIGIYGVAAHSASRRTREVGIRMSLGARRFDVFRMFIRESLMLSLIGISIGLGISVAASKLMATFLFGLTATDIVTFVGATGVLCFVIALASYIPARRVASIDPFVALRCD